MYMIISMLLLFIFVTSTVLTQRCNIGCNERTRFKFLLLKKEGVHVDTSKVKVGGVYILETQKSE